MGVTNSGRKDHGNAGNGNGSGHIGRLGNTTKQIRRLEKEVDVILRKTTPTPEDVEVLRRWDGLLAAERMQRRTEKERARASRALHAQLRKEPEKRDVMLVDTLRLYLRYLSRNDVTREAVRAADELISRSRKRNYSLLRNMLDRQNAG